MANDLRALEDWAGALLSKLEPKERRRLNQIISRDLRRAQQQRVAAQKNPDGSPFEPRRKQKLRSKKGRVKQKMFTKLRQARFLKLQSDPNRIAISFASRASRLARVHHYGLRDRPARGAPDVQYPVRKLLGLTDADLELIRDKLLEHLAP